MPEIAGPWPPPAQLKPPPAQFDVQLPLSNVDLGSWWANVGSRMRLRDEPDSQAFNRFTRLLWELLNERDPQALSSFLGRGTTMRVRAQTRALSPAQVAIREAVRAGLVTRNARGRFTHFPPALRAAVRRNIAKRRPKKPTAAQQRRALRRLIADLRRS